MNADGRLIVFEGIDRAGKSTLIEELYNELKEESLPVTRCGELMSPLKDLIREELSRGSTPFLKTYLFAADRAWTYEQCCMPALNEGKLVLWDRYVDSAIIYRKVELRRKVSTIGLDLVQDINKQFREPDLSIYIDISVETSLQRAQKQRKNKPYDAEFLQEVKEEYLKYAKEKNYELVNGEASVEQIIKTVRKKIDNLLKERSV